MVAIPAAPTPACLRKRRRLTRWWTVRSGVSEGMLGLLLWGAIEGKDPNSGPHDARGARGKSSGIFGREPRRGTRSGAKARSRAAAFPDASARHRCSPALDFG